MTPRRLFPSPLAVSGAAALLLLVAGACSDDAGSSSGGDTGSDSTADAGDDDSGGRPLPMSCDPEPGQCDAFGTDRPGRLSEHSAAYDPDRLEMVVFGGSSAVPQRCDFPPPIFEGDTWIYDEPCNAWTQVEGGPNPGPRVRHMMTFGDGRAWLFGGRFRGGGTTYTLYDDLWTFDMETRAWALVPVTGERPGARVNGAFVWDSRRGLLWLFGGNESTAGTVYRSLRDLWSFDPATTTWTPHTISGTQPSERLFHAGFYDPVRDAFIIFGGADDSALDFNSPVFYFKDLWSLDLDSLAWLQVHSGASSAPDGRFWAGGIYDPIDDQYVVFGGHDDASLGNRNDTWAFDPATAIWAPTTGEDVIDNGDVDFCDFPPDFTAIAAEVPERRNAHTMVWSSCGGALVFGGKTDCGALDDVWHYEDGVWEERLPATVGEVCIRWRSNPDNCANLCF